MWTNVFRIGGLQQISWFQFLPCESDPNSLPEKSLKAEQKDAATLVILSSHLHLQNEGFLSTWTNSFVGPWDPSQGMHNPDEKIKLWLFLPGRHSSVVETAQPAVSKLRVIGAGFWAAPGGSEEVAAALSQALRNCIERALRRLAYVRFGDVFTRCQSFGQSEKYFRRVQPTCEFIFAASEEAIFVHVIIHAKHVRMLLSEDMERVSRHHSSNNYGEKLPVIVAPHGMRGRLTGCCPSDLVKQVYFSKVNKASNGFSILGIPFHAAQSSPNCQLRGQSCYVEITLGCPGTRTNFSKNTLKHHISEPSLAPLAKGERQGLGDHIPVLGRTFVYPAETVLVPIMQAAFARSSRKRFWLQNWVGTSPFEALLLVNDQDSSILKNCSGIESSVCINSLMSPWLDSSRSYNSSSNSNSSSISSISSTSSDSDYGIPAGGRDLEADADSHACRQSGLSTHDQFDNDGHKMVSKRLRPGTTESFGQAGTVINAMAQDVYRSDYSGVEGNNSVTAGGANDQVGSHWDWDDDDRGMGMDIQTLLSEFGDFGDFFEDDVLAFGEPPGTAESQALMFPATDCGDISSSPCTAAVDVQDQMPFPAVGFSSFDSFNQPPPAIIEETFYKTQEFTKDARSSGAYSNLSMPSTGEFDLLSKAEAKLTFALEYAAVEMPTSEFSKTIFRSPYLPKSRKVESSHSNSNSYVYGATPPSSPSLEVSDEKPDVSAKGKGGPGRRDAGFLQSNKYYTHIQSAKQQLDERLVSNNNGKASGKGEIVSSSVSGSNAASAVVSLQRKKAENTLEGGHFLLSLKTLLASEVECSMFQAAMCRIRHILLSHTNIVSGSSGLTGYTVFDQIQSDASTMPDKISNIYDVKKRESIPVRIAGDADGGMLDGPINAPVGVWRSVGVPRGAKPGNISNIDSSSSLPQNQPNDEGMTYGQMQPLQELLDAMALLVQQATAFVDVSLDMDHGEGPYGWLALQEQRRRGFSCGPFMVHAGCGGLLATCHSVDIAGIKLLDPLSADVHASSVVSLLQSDIKVALKSAFGSLDGPLAITDWCKGRSQLGDAGTPGDGYSADCSFSDTRDSSNTVTLAVGEPISPPQSLSGASSCLKDGARIDDSSQRRSSQDINNSESEQQLSYSRLKPTLLVLPLPAILVGYQEDWLKASSNSLQLWEKAPLEPYALPKPINYYVVCPDINPLVTAAVDFFQQLGTVYEACKLGTHSPQVIGGQMELGPGKLSSSGFVPVDCPQTMKLASTNSSVMGSVSEYLVALSKAWDVRSFLKSLSKVLKTLRLGSNSAVNQKENNSGPCTAIYVVCPFPEPVAVLKTLIEASAAVGSSVLSLDKERRSLMQAQVSKALNCSAAVDEASTSNVLTLSGFSIPKLVLQIVSVEAIFRVNSPVLNELVILKEIAFTVYNKARRIPRASSSDLIQSTAISGRPQSTLMHMTSPVPGLWKDCVTPRIAGSSLSREGELDAGLRAGSWDNSWQTSRSVGLNCDQNRTGDFFYQDDVHYMFEPLFILAEPGSVEHGVVPAMFSNAAASESSSSRPAADDASGGYMQSAASVGSTDTALGSLIDGSESDGFVSSHQKIASLHCSYGWTEDWRWLVCIWTDSRGELLDSHVFPFGGISSRQDTKGLQSLFVQVLQQGCLILSSSSPDAGTVKPREIVIARIGCFYELECQEWQKAIYSIGGNEVKKWPLQLRRSIPDGISSTSNGTSLQQPEMSLVQERTLPSSPNPSLYSSHVKSSGFMKSGLGQGNARKQLLVGQTAVDSSRGMFQWVQSITLVGVSVDHSLHLVFPADTSSQGGGTQGSGIGSSGYVEGFTPVKSLGSIPASYVIIPSPSIRFLPPNPMQLPTCLTAESPPLAHLLHSKGSAIPLSTGFVVSKAVPKADEWPSTLSVSLVDYYGGGSSSCNDTIHEKMIRGNSKQGRSLNSEVRDLDSETHTILETVAAELHALSWMTVSPAFLERRTALPFHCDMLLRLRRLLHYADKEFSQHQPERSQQV